jgi:hypothetical protein
MVVYWRIVAQAPLSGCLAFGSPNQPHPGRIIRSADEFDSGSFESTLNIVERLRPARRDTLMLLKALDRETRHATTFG